MKNTLIGMAALYALGAASIAIAKSPKQPHADTDQSRPAIQSVSARHSIAAAINHKDRPAADQESDHARKPDEVLLFAGLEPGMTIMELEAGSGYYTEIMSRVVGESGAIYMHNPPSFDEFVTPSILNARLGADRKRLGNVTLTKTSFDALDMDDNCVDMVTWVLGPHELWLRNNEGELELGDAAKTYAEIYRVLKPGGTFLVIDIKTAANAPETTGGTTHRISPRRVRERAEAAGLVLTKTSDILANKANMVDMENLDPRTRRMVARNADKYDINIFDPSVRGKTDRFVHLYTKPK